MSISAIGCGAAARWTTKRASSPWKRLDRRAGNACRRTRFSVVVPFIRIPLLFRAAEAQLPSRRLLIGDLGEKHLGRVDRLPRRKPVQELCHGLVGPGNK